MLDSGLLCVPVPAWPEHPARRTEGVQPTPGAGIMDGYVPTTAPGRRSAP